MTITNEAFSFFPFYFILLYFILPVLQFFLFRFLYSFSACKSLKKNFFVSFHFYLRVGRSLSTLTFFFPFLTLYSFFRSRFSFLRCVFSHSFSLITLLASHFLSLFSKYSFLVLSNRKKKHLRNKEKSTKLLRAMCPALRK